MRASVIIPTYNESKNIQILIPKLYNAFKENNLDGRIIVVDDASSDGTDQVLKDIKKKSNNIDILERQGKFGIGSAYKDGFRYALSLNSDIFIQMDADLSHDPMYIQAFLEKLEDGHDVVIGSRYVKNGNTKNWGLNRKLISRSANALARFLLNLHTHDVTSGYRAFKRKAFDKIDLSEVMSDSFVFQVETLLHCEQAGLRIGEVPITFLDRQFGESKLKLKDIYIYFTSVFKLMLTYRLKNNKMKQRIDLQKKNI